MTLLGQNGVPTQSYAFLPVVPGLRAWATRSGTYAATMVRECKKFGMKPVCDDPSLCANDANALYIGHNGSLARQQSGPLGFIEVAHLWSARCSYGGTGPSFAYSLPVHPFHARRDRVASLTTCRLHGAAIQRA